MSAAPLRPAPAPLRPAPALAIALLVLLAAAAPQQLPARTRPDTVRRTYAKTSVSGRERAPRFRGGGDVDFGRLLGILAGPQLQLAGPQFLAQTSTLAQLAALFGADTVLPLFEASVGASSGGRDNPAAVGTDESSEEVADLVV